MKLIDWKENMTEFEDNLKQLVTHAQEVAVIQEHKRIIDLLETEIKVQLLGDPDKTPSMPLMDVLKLIVVNR